jgi:hypothetical protein
MPRAFRRDDYRHIANRMDFMLRELRTHRVR